MIKKAGFIALFVTVLTLFCGLNQSARATRSHHLVERDFADLGKKPIISNYDQLMRTVGEAEGQDWRLMSAIAYHESRFMPNLTSPSGARGLMQIMPSVARQFEVPVESIADPTTNVWLAGKLLGKLTSMLRLPAETPEEDKLSLLLASYNGGIGHINDARRLARYHGENANSWEVVSRYLALKSQPEYYQLSVVKCGRFTGFGQTQAYVKDVMKRYQKYRLLTK